MTAGGVGTGATGPGDMPPGTAPDVVLVDAGGANIASVRFALERWGIDAPLTADVGRIRQADRVILPGVGAAGAAMRRLHELDLVDVLRGLEQPVLGVCLGMQLLHEASTEGQGGRSTDEAVECLGLVPGVVRQLPAGGVRVPHMGWNVLESGPAFAEDSSGPVARVLREAWADGVEPRAYYVHSWAAPVGEHSLATTTHGQPFTSIVQRGNVTGMQFHPERSGALGSRLLAAFCGVLPGGAS
ncbi:imidazole glycerol phosphate synthase subunit HisH [Kytococcus sp. Marseille-QA3725]